MLCRELLILLHNVHEIMIFFLRRKRCLLCMYDLCKNIIRTYTQYSNSMRNIIYSICFQ